MQDDTKTRDQLLEEIVELRQALVEQGRANLLLNDNRTMSTKRFASGIAHEINNPLGIISGFAELTLLNPGLPPTIRGDLLVMLSECNRASRMLHNLLGFSGDRQLAITQVNLDLILTQVLKLKSNEFDVYHIEVTRESAPDLPDIPADGDQLIEVLLNILDNAQQAMTEARGGGKIHIASHLVEDRVSISISDTGPGITPANLAKIFNPFFTTKLSGKGTGLGLSISHEIMSQHGGSLWAESTPDNGATFHLELPLESLSPTAIVDGGVAPEHRPVAVNENSKRILVVNDELGFRQLLSRALSPGGQLVDLAADWVEAWNLVQNNSYDCIILNLGLPAVSGMQLYERIKDYNSRLAERCVFITGYILTPDIEEALKATGVPYLTKPFAISQIRRIVLDTVTTSRAISS
jgi:nitrogen-specific signal transduction histidine kinase/CheY-like chemotaxis protein